MPPDRLKSVLREIEGSMGGGYWRGIVEGHGRETVLTCEVWPHTHKHYIQLWLVRLMMVCSVLPDASEALY